MKVLLDEELPHKLRASIEGHEVSTVAYLGWSGLRNGKLLRVAGDAGFDAFVTGDKNLAHQQNRAGRMIAVIVLSAQEWPI